MIFFRIIYSDRRGRHVGAPYFLDRAKANRQRRLLLNDPAVREARVVPVRIRPLPFAPGQRSA